MRCIPNIRLKALWRKSLINPTHKRDDNIKVDGDGVEQVKLTTGSSC
jgi:hypothetical protein